MIAHRRVYFGGWIKFGDGLNRLITVSALMHGDKGGRPCTKCTQSENIFPEISLSGFVQDAVPSNLYVKKRSVIPCLLVQQPLRHSPAATFSSVQTFSEIAEINLFYPKVVCFACIAFSFWENQIPSSNIVIMNFQLD